MYIQIDDTKYENVNARFGRNLVWTSVNNLATYPVTAIVRTYRDDGYILREDDPADWERQTYESEILTFTNDPEPEPYEPPEPPEYLFDPSEVMDVLHILTGTRDDTL